MKVRISSGREGYSPVQYHSFDVGSIEIEIDVPEPVQPGTLEAVVRQAHARLELLVAAEFERKLNAYLDRMVKAGQIVAARRK